MGKGKFYWLKLDKDFFKRHDIKIIESMPKGKDYILFYLKLLCESLDHEGNLRFNDQIPYNEDMLATITSTDPDTVRSAIQVFSNLKMIEILDDGTYFMNAVKKIIGSETKWAGYKRDQREKTEAVNRSIGQNEILKIGQCPTDVQDLSKNCPIEIEKDIEKEIEIDKERERTHARMRLGLFNNVLLTQGELEELQRLNPDDWQDMIENLSLYMQSKGKYYEDHYATMMSWKRKDKQKARSGTFWDEFDKEKEAWLNDETGDK